MNDPIGELPMEVAERMIGLNLSEKEHGMLLKDWYVHRGEVLIVIDGNGGSIMRVPTAADAWQMLHHVLEW